MRSFEWSYNLKNLMDMYEARQNKEKVSRIICKSMRHKGMMQMCGRGTHMELRPRKTETNGHEPPTNGYTQHYIYKNILTKPSGETPFLWWTDPKRQKVIVTDGNRTNDQKQVPQASSGYVWHHSELVDVSGTCYMQEVPEYQHKDISHRGGISQFDNDPM